MSQRPQKALLLQPLEILIAPFQRPTYRGALVAKLLFRVIAPTLACPQLGHGALARHLSVWQEPEVVSLDVV